MEQDEMYHFHKLKCWVPNCTKLISNKKDLIPLPDNPKHKEIWLALAGKPVEMNNLEIYFCTDHFSVSGNNTNSFPVSKLPERICRLCLSIIESSTSHYILSKYIPMERPLCVKDMVHYCVPSIPQPPHMVVYNTIGLDVEYNPPQFICDSCLISVWLFHTFKTFAIEVERILKGDTSLEIYQKMVLCRTCPVLSGTNFVLLEEESIKGQILKSIFQQNDDEKNHLPLRTCTKCFEILNRLEPFYETCLIAEKKTRLQIQMEKNILQHRKKTDASLLQLKQNCDILKHSSQQSNDVLSMYIKEPPKSVTKKSQIVSKRDFFWSEAKEIEFLRLICQEATHLQKQSETNKKINWQKVLAFLKTKNSKYRTIPDAILRRKVKDIKMSTLLGKTSARKQKLVNMADSLVIFNFKGMKKLKKQIDSANLKDGKEEIKQKNTTAKINVKSNKSDKDFQSQNDKHKVNNRKNSSDQPEIDERSFVKAVHKEFNYVIKEYVIVNNPIQETLIRLSKNQFSNCSVEYLTSKWNKLKATNQSKKNLALKERDKIVLYVKKKNKEYQQKRLWLMNKSQTTLSPTEPTGSFPKIGRTYKRFAEKT